MEGILGLVLADKCGDMELVDKARAGNSSAFDSLFHRHKQMIFNVCLGILGSREDAVDAAQCTFVQAYKSLHTFKGQSSLQTWLYRIAVNTSIGVTRKQKRRSECVLESEAPDMGKPCDDRVWEAMFEMSSDLRAVLVLFYFQGLSGRELSEALGCSEGTARTRLHRARQIFKEKYEEVGK